MTDRRPYIGGNWKMNTNRETAATLTRDVVEAIGDRASRVDVAVFPPFPYLLTVGAVLRERNSPITLGAQDLWLNPDGAFTGEVSAEMLEDCGVRPVLAGHSERRQVIGEADELVNLKVRRTLEAGLDCVLCVGETLEQRDAGETDKVNERQVRAGLAEVTPAQMPRVVIAYEPVWAIGTGKTATPDDAQDAHAKIRSVLTDLYGQHLADATRIIYGGSMKPGNAAELIAQPDIDGGLIGGASLKGADFGQIVAAAAG
ncbi:MAG: triose-phosphate isomerase [Phycisphaerae bacterium]|nr:triose-phosphate isomerase [Phycisphaerae bacterium]